jgi:hypothetical protein
LKISRPLRDDSKPRREEAREDGLQRLRVLAQIVLQPVTMEAAIASNTTQPFRDLRRSRPAHRRGLARSALVDGDSRPKATVRPTSLALIELRIAAIGCRLQHFSPNTLPQIPHAGEQFVEAQLNGLQNSNVAGVAEPRLIHNQRAVEAGLHLSRGQHDERVGQIGGIGSVAISAVPVLEKT